MEDVLIKKEKKKCEKCEGGIKTSLKEDCNQTRITSQRGTHQWNRLTVSGGCSRLTCANRLQLVKISQSMSDSTRRVYDRTRLKFQEFHSDKINLFVLLPCLVPEVSSALPAQSPLVWRW